MKKSFEKKFLVEDLDLPWSSLEETIVYQKRWSTIYEIIFEFENKFYKTIYSKGSTEIQDESPWEDDEEVECVEVRKVKKMVDVWEEVSE